MLCINTEGQAPQITDKIKDEIDKDLKRTNTSARVKTEEGQEELRRVLLAVAFCVPDIGYCQGMNFIAGLLIDSLEGNEDHAFLVFMFLIIERDMKPLFLPGVPELHLKNYQMAQLIKFHMYKFFSHLRSLQMTTDIFTNKWFMTLFACFLPFHLVQPIFDMFLLEGWVAIFKVGLALLQELEPRLVTMDLAEICMFFRDNIKSQEKILD